MQDSCWPSAILLKLFAASCIKVFPLQLLLYNELNVVDILCDITSVLVIASAAPSCHCYETSVLVIASAAPTC
ncbi:MAG: hypothetical protein PHC92_10420, partial [Syntrophomonadaceae bacterium]|nr:hypothetical protein [Syntrophomonadaceae bacterium]